MDPDGTECIWFYGWLLSPGAPSPSFAHAYNYALLSRCACVHIHTGPPTRSRQAHGQAQPGSREPGVPIPTAVGPVSTGGTELRAINLFARQPATCHCVYPHVNHYVRPRNIELAPRAPRSAANSYNLPFPAVAAQEMRLPGMSSISEPQFGKRIQAGIKRTLDERLR